MDVCCCYYVIPCNKLKFGILCNKPCSQMAITEQLNDNNWTTILIDTITPEIDFTLVFLQVSHLELCIGSSLLQPIIQLVKCCFSNPRLNGKIMNSCWAVDTAFFKNTVAFEDELKFIRVVFFFLCLFYDIVSVIRHVMRGKRKLRKPKKGGKWLIPTGK